MNNNLPKNKILRGKKAISDLFEKGKYIKNNSIVLIYKASNDFKIAFAVSRRIRGAVRRNRLKRQLREIYRTNKAFFPEKKYLILMGKSEACSFTMLRRDVLGAVSKINK